MRPRSRARPPGMLWAVTSRTSGSGMSGRSCESAALGVFGVAGVGSDIRVPRFACRGAAAAGPREPPGVLLLLRARRCPDGGPSNSTCEAK